MVAKAVRTEWKPEQGLVIVYGDSGAAKDGIAIPLAAFPTLAAQARRFVSGARAAQATQPGVTGWHYSEHCVAQTYNVGLVDSSDGEKVSLILDRGLETEIGFAIDPAHARELGQELSETASRASSTPQPKN